MSAYLDTKTLRNVQRFKSTCLTSNGMQTDGRTAFQSYNIDWILINTINMLAILAETKSEDQWQSKPTRSKFGCYHCNMHLKIRYGREERHRKESYVVFIPKKYSHFALALWRKK